MNDHIPRVAALLADPARATMVKRLIDGTARPAGELADAASVSAQSASAHLSKLVAGGLLAATAQGRHRYFRIAGPQVADAVESLAALSAAVTPLRSLPLSTKPLPVEFVRARTCYDHLAGEMAVWVCEAMVKTRWLVPAERDFRVTRLGEEKLAALGVDLDRLRLARRAFARACVDLTQRRHHVGGALGAALLDLYIARGWILRGRRSRAVSITPKGNAAFGSLFS